MLVSFLFAYYCFLLKIQAFRVFTVSIDVSLSIHQYTYNNDNTKTDILIVNFIEKKRKKKQFLSFLTMEILLKFHLLSCNIIWTVLVCIKNKHIFMHHFPVFVFNLVENSTLLYETFYWRGAERQEKTKD